MSLEPVPEQHPTSEEEAFFRRNVPVSLLKSILRTVFDGCIAAYDQAKADVAPAFFSDALPTARRVKVEPALLGLILPKGFSATLQATTTTRYTEIRSERIVLTAMSRSEAVRTVEVALYRDMLARTRQLSLSFEDQVRFNPANGLYGILVYGGPHRRRLPSMARIVFPQEDGTFMPEEIDLIREFPEIVGTYEGKGGDDFGLRTDEGLGEG